MLEWNELLLRLLLASLFGALIGLERERKEWAAGMRTHMMVSVGSCLIMIVSAYGFTEVLHHPSIDLDPSRVAAQVVSGIGFIGAGTILFLKQGVVRGLTTASGLWTVAAIGLATGGGLYFAAAATTIIALLILWALQPLQHLLTKRDRHHTIRIESSSKLDKSQLIERIFEEQNFKTHSFSFKKGESQNSYTILLESSGKESTRLKELVETLREIPEVEEIYWNREW